MDLSQISRISCAASTTCTGRPERDTGVTRAPSLAMARVERCRSRRDRCRFRSCSRCFARSSSRRRFARAVSRFRRHCVEQVFCDSMAERCARYHFRQPQHRRRDFLGIPMTGRSRPRPTHCKILIVARPESRSARAPTQPIRPRRLHRRADQAATASRSCPGPVPVTPSDGTRIPGSLLANNPGSFLASAEGAPRRSEMYRHDPRLIPAPTPLVR